MNRNFFPMNIHQYLRIIRILLVLFVIALWLFSGFPQIPTAKALTINLQVPASSDDAARSGSTAGVCNNVALTGVEVFTGRLGAASVEVRTGGFRFTNVNIPQGATITSATWQGYLTRSQGAPTLVFRGQAADSALSFAATCADFDGRTKTTASVNFAPGSVTNTWYSSPDFAAVIQEIVNRPGWTSGNALVLFLDWNGTDAASNGRAWQAFDGNAANAPKLDISYTVTFEQSGYRWFENTSDTTVSTALGGVGENTPATLTTNGQAFRLRLLIHVGVSSLPQSAQSFKLQFAEKSGSCDTGFINESYSDVAVTSTIAYFNNTPSDGTALTPNPSLDPTHLGHTVVSQTYEELNNFTNSVAAIPSGQDGQWDFALFDYSASSNKSYCFRAVKSDNSLLDTYTVIPEIAVSTAYVLSGTYESSQFNTGATKSFNVLEWNWAKSNASCSGCTLSIEVSSAPDVGGSPGTWTLWQGPYSVSATGDARQLLPTVLNGNRWVRYRVTFNGDGTDSPILSEIKINYQPP